MTGIRRGALIVAAVLASLWVWVPSVAASGDTELCYVYLHIHERPSVGPGSINGGEYHTHQTCVTITCDGPLCDPL